MHIKKLFSKRKLVSQCIYETCSTGDSPAKLVNRIQILSSRFCANKREDTKGKRI